MISLNELNIGFEFEFLFPSDILKKEKNHKPYSINSPIAHAIYHEGIELFLNAITKQNDKFDWFDICMPRQDSTVHSSEHKYYAGIEIATKVQSGELAMVILDEMLKLLSKSPFKTNDTCGIHFNVSFKEKMPNAKTLSFYTSKNLDIHAINKRFKREKNEHCKPNFEGKISREEMGVLLFDTLFQDEKEHHYYTNYAKFEDKINELRKKQNLIQFLTLVKEQIIDDSTFTWDNERPAIAHKKFNQIEYLEFRSMGGKNYPKKREIILNTISEFLEAMFKARNSIFKDSTLKTRKY